MTLLSNFCALVAIALIMRGADAFETRSPKTLIKLGLMGPITRTTISTSYLTVTEILTSGIYTEQFEFVTITNLRGRLPRISSTSFEQFLTFTDPWTPGPTITTTTIIYVDVTITSGSTITPTVPTLTFTTITESSTSSSSATTSSFSIPVIPTTPTDPSSSSSSITTSSQSTTTLLDFKMWPENQTVATHVMEIIDYEEIEDIQPRRMYYADEIPYFD